MLITLSMIAFMIAYSIKGGWASKIAHVRDLRQRNKFLNRAFDGKVLSTFIVFLFCMISDWSFTHGVMMAAVWLLAVSPSMGEEAGAIGRIGYWWGEYKDVGFSRSYGIKKGLQRGVWTGAIFTVALGTPALSVPVLGLGFVACHFALQEVYFRIHKTDSWVYVEPAYGIIIGLCYAISMGA